MRILDDAPWAYPFKVRDSGSDIGTYRDVLNDGDHLPLVALGPDFADFTPTRILDLGANIGATMCDYAFWYPDAYVLGVEMWKDNVDIAAENTAWITGRASVRHAAVVGQGQCRKDVRFDVPDGGYNAARLSASGSHSSPSVCLECLNAGTFDLVKMDIEGAEAEALDITTYIFRATKVIIVEVHPPHSVDQIQSELAMLGFSVRPHLRHPTALCGIRI